MSEQSGPVVFSPADVPANAHPQGVAIVSNGNSPPPAGGGRLGLGEVVLALGQIQEIGRRGQLAAVSNSASERLPLVVNLATRTTDMFLQAGATIGEVGSTAHRDGQRLDLSELDPVRLDALFGSAVGAAIALSAGHLPQGSG